MRLQPIDISSALRGLERKEQTEDNIPEFVEFFNRNNKAILDKASKRSERLISPLFFSWNSIHEKLITSAVILSLDDRNTNTLPVYSSKATYALAKPVKYYDKHIQKNKESIVKDMFRLLKGGYLIIVEIFGLKKKTNRYGKTFLKRILPSTKYILTMGDLGKSDKVYIIKQDKRNENYLISQNSSYRRMQIVLWDLYVTKLKPNVTFEIATYKRRFMNKDAVLSYLRSSRR